MKNLIIYTLGAGLIFGGVYTFYTTTSVLFDWFESSNKTRPFVRMSQVCCFISSFFYLICGVLFFLKKKIATQLLFIATIIMFIGYIGMLFHINSGKAIELQTIAEMLIRTTVTMLYAAASWYIFTRTRFVFPPGHDAKSFRKLMREHSKREMRHNADTF